MKYPVRNLRPAQVGKIIKANKIVLGDIYETNRAAPIGVNRAGLTMIQ